MKQRSSTPHARREYLLGYLLRRHTTAVSVAPSSAWAWSTVLTRAPVPVTHTIVQEEEEWDGGSLVPAVPGHFRGSERNRVVVVRRKDVVL